MTGSPGAATGLDGSRIDPRKALDVALRQGSHQRYGLSSVAGGKVRPSQPARKRQAILEPPASGANSMKYGLISLLPLQLARQRRASPAGRVPAKVLGPAGPRPGVHPDPARRAAGVPQPAPHRRSAPAPSHVFSIKPWRGGVCAKRGADTAPSLLAGARVLSGCG